MSTTLLAGASGLIGHALAYALRADGETVRILVRRDPRTPQEVRWEPDAGLLPEEALDGVTTVVNLGGVGVGDHRWTETHKKAILHSRVAGTTLLATRLAARRATGTRLLQASAVGYYGDAGEAVVHEDHPSGTGYLAEVCRAWEASTSPAQEAGVPVVLMRTGIVLDPGGGAVGRLMPLLRLGVAGPLGTGRQWWPWISLEDEVRAIRHLAGSAVTGPVNLSAPNPERNGDLTRTLARALHRPALVPVPGLALRITLGEFAGELLASQRVVPTVLEADGFTFAQPELDGAAGALVNR